MLYTENLPETITTIRVTFKEGRDGRDLIYIDYEIANDVKENGNPNAYSVDLHEREQFDTSYDEMTYFEDVTHDRLIGPLQWEVAEWYKTHIWKPELREDYERKMAEMNADSK